MMPLYPEVSQYYMFCSIFNTDIVKFKCSDGHCRHNLASPYKSHYNNQSVNTIDPADSPGTWWWKIPKYHIIVLNCLKWQVHFLNYFAASITFRKYFNFNHMMWWWSQTIKKWRWYYYCCFQKDWPSCMQRLYLKSIFIVAHLIPHIPL